MIFKNHREWEMHKDSHQYPVLLTHLLDQHMSYLPTKKSQIEFISKNMRNGLFLHFSCKPKQAGGQ